MARYQFLRPTPVKVFPRRFRRQAPPASGPPAVGAAPAEGDESEEEEVEEGPESPDSPGSSSDEGGLSSSDESESESESEGEEPPSPAESGSPVSSNSAVNSPSNIPDASNGSGNNAALPQITDAASSTGRTPTTIVTSSRVPSSSTSFGRPAQSDARKNESPQISAQQQDAPLMTRTAAVAATVLGVLGALALIIGIVILIKHRKRKQRNHDQRLADDAFNSDNTGSLHVPETAHIEGGSSLFSHIGGGGGSGAGHLTQSSARSNTLFGPGAYERPETVSTERNNSRFPIAPPIPTPNPFADPPLNKAYDVLAGRPRSTTLTDRGSWVKNPFQNPESERFDPFGELKAKARMERVKHMEEIRRDAEREVVRGYEEKERMGLMPEAVPGRKASGITLEGVGVLDRSAGGSYY
ncbi:hypothetical protein NX059_002906 [Plenodomus lindquistii]|nr:hypothetical protein NX059_002906 [Plenodomus lindquistii]